MNDRTEALLDKQEVYELSCKYMRGLDRQDDLVYDREARYRT